MTQTATPPRRGIGFLSAFFLVLFVLKVTGFLGWSWWWVTAPLWAPFALWFGLLALAALVIGLAKLVTWPARRRKKARRR